MFAETEQPKAAEKISLTNLSSACVREQVALICQSEDFVSAERLKQFLHFVVEETLSGRGDRLKAYSIALGVFDRDHTFDPNTDSIVRIEASRLRRALEHYYLTDGRQDPILITIPKGRYSPLAEIRQPDEEVPNSFPPTQLKGTEAAGEEPRVSQPRRRWLRSIPVAAVLSAALLAFAAYWWSSQASLDRVVLVLPFVESGDLSASASITAGLTGTLMHTLADRTGVRVMGRETTRWGQTTSSLADLRREYNLTHVLEGDVIAEPDKVTIFARLVETQTNAVRWASRYEKSQSTSLADIKADIGSQVLVTLGTKPQTAPTRQGLLGQKAIGTGG
jgi:adenylate cyclase